MIFLIIQLIVPLVVVMIIISVYLYLTLNVRPKNVRPFGYLSDTKAQSAYWCDNMADALYEIIKLKDVPESEQRLFFGTRVDINELHTLVSEVAIDEDDLQEKLSWLFAGIHDDEDVYTYDAETRYKLFKIVSVSAKLFCKMDKKHCEKYLYQDNWDFFFNRARHNFNDAIPMEKLNYDAVPLYALTDTCDTFCDPRVVSMIDDLKSKEGVYEAVWDTVLDRVCTKAFSPTNVGLIATFFNWNWSKERTQTATTDSFTNDVRAAVQRDTNFSKERLHAFETLVYALETTKGPGLLVHEAPGIMQEYHKKVLLSYAKKHASKLERAKRIDETFLKTMQTVLVAIKKLKLSVEHEFPALWYFDTKSVADKPRLRLEYNEMMKDMFDTIKFNFSTIGKLFDYFKRHPSVHKRHDEDFIFMAGVNALLNVRKQAVDIGRKPGRFILRTLDGFIEGFEEQFTQEMEAEKKNGRVVEPFGKAIVRALMKPMKPIFMLVEMLIFIFKVGVKLVKILTDPIKLIMLPIVFMYIMMVVVLSLIEFYAFHILTAVLLGVFTIAYLAIVTVISFVFTTIYVVLGHIDVEVFNAFFAVYMYILFVSSENDIRSWYTVPSFEQGNMAYRGLFGAFAPCGTNFSHGPFFCHKKSPYVPLFSPQANIYKIVNGTAVYGQTEPKNFFPSPNFHDLPEARKSRLIKHADRSKRKYFRNVKKFGSGNDGMIRTICQNVDALELSSTKKEDIGRLCYTSLCQNGNFEPFCAAMNYERSEDTSNSDKIEKYLHLVSYIVMLSSLVGLLYVGYGRTGKQDIVDIFSYPKQLLVRSK